MKNLLHIFVFHFLASLALTVGVFAEDLLKTHTFEEHIQPLLEEYCYKCHNEEETRGDFDITPYQTGEQIFADREEWLYVLEQIETEEMPTKEPLPSSEERALMVAWINQRLNDVDWSQVREAGHVTIPRLNKTEYQNTLRDLFGFPTRAGSRLSNDGEGQSGFTTDRDNLFITASDMEKYFEAASEVIEASFAFQSEPEQWHFESEEMLITEASSPVLKKKGLTGYEVNRGQMTLYESIDFPHDGLYEFSVKAAPTVSSTGGLRLRINNEPSGDFYFEEPGASTESFTIFVPRGSYQVALNYEKSLLPPEVQKQYKRANKVGSTLVDWMKVKGPVRPENMPATSPVFFVIPQSVGVEEAATRIITRFAERAFRRPLEEGEADRYLSLFYRAAEQRENFASSIKLSLSAILVSPHFLFRHELAPSGSQAGEFRLNDYQLASRLSYFLWMSMPDQELFRLAKKGELSEPETLRAQVRRMIADPKSRSFTDAFLGEWLGYQSVGVSVIPDEKIFPEFDEALARAMKDETILTFEHLLRNNHPLSNLLDTKATFINERLAEHYKVPHVEGEHMRPLAISDSHRGGLLGMASVLTATSSPTRTSPVVRGKWVLETILGEHVPEPPEDAGELSPDAGQNKGTTLREELEIHRNNPDCQSCHQKIDPIGFGLENFDAIGRFRTRENGKPIDNSGELEGHRFRGTAELKSWLLSEKKETFIENVSSRMLAFALGRNIETFDQGPLLEIKENLAASDFGTMSLIEEVVLSHPFLHQNNQQPNLEYSP